MAERQTGYYWHVEVLEPFLQDVRKCLPKLLRPLAFRIITICVQADSDTSDLPQDARVKQIRQHSIETVGRLIQVLEKQYFPPERDLKRRCESGAEQGKISANQWASRFAFSNHGNGFSFIAGTQAASRPRLHGRPKKTIERKPR